MKVLAVILLRDFAAFVPEYEVEADDRLGLRGLAVVQDGRLGLGPDKASAVGQEAVVTGGHLTFGQHCTAWTGGRGQTGEKKQRGDE